MGLLDRFKEKRVLVANEGLPRFRELVFMAAEKGDLPDKQLAELAKLADELGIDSDRIDELMAEAKRYKAQQEAAKGLDEANAKAQKAIEEHKDFVEIQYAAWLRGSRERREKAVQLESAASTKRGAKQETEEIAWRCPELYGDAETVAQWRDTEHWGKRRTGVPTIDSRGNPL